MTSNEHDRDRDKASGRFVSDAYADEHPDTTTSEPIAPHLVTADMVAAAMGVADQFAASGPTSWWADPKKVATVLKAAMAAREAE